MTLSRRDFIKTVSLGAFGGLLITPAQALAQRNWFAEINRIRVPQKLSGKEKGHAPLIIIPKEEGGQGLASE